MLEKIVSHVQWYTAKGTMDSKLQRITARVAKINTFGLFQQPAISVAKILIRFFPLRCLTLVQLAISAKF